MIGDCLPYVLSPTKPLSEPPTPSLFEAAHEAHCSKLRTKRSGGSGVISASAAYFALCAAQHFTYIVRGLDKLACAALTYLVGGLNDTSYDGRDAAGLFSVSS